MTIDVGDKVIVKISGVVALVPPSKVTQAALIRIGSTLIPVLCEGNVVIEEEKIIGRIVDGIAE